MQVLERVVVDVQPTDATWFATRQPGIVRYLETHCEGDVLAIALHTACGVHAAFEATLGVAPARVQGSLLTRAERAVMAEAEAETGADGVVQRQPALAELVASVVCAPPLPLTNAEASALGLALLTVVYALDEVATGRSVP